MTTQSTAYRLSTKNRHPELQPGEVFFMNMTSADFRGVSYSSKRLGCQAYLSDGTPYKKEAQTYPVFVSLAELLAAGVSVEGAPSPR